MNEMEFEIEGKELDIGSDQKRTNPFKGISKQRKISGSKDGTMKYMILMCINRSNYLAL